jgi:hypothetical protein
VDNYNAVVCVSQGWKDFVEAEAQEFPKAMLPSKTWQGAAAVGAIKKSAAGVRAIAEWLGGGLRPVEKLKAENRGGTCATCPLNQLGNFWQKLDAAAAKQIKDLVEAKNDMQLATPIDDKLHSCTACDCWVPLKIWVPLKHVMNNTSREVRSKLDPGCWILHEQ